MADSLRDMPPYVRVRPDGQWQGADHQNGPWCNIPAPQMGTPWHAPTHTQQPSTIDPTICDRIALVLCQAQDGGPPCPAPCVRCRAMAAAAAHEIADYFSELYGDASTTADTLYAVGCHQPATEPSIQDGWKALECEQDPRMWPPIDPEKVAAALAVGRELRRPDA